MYGRIDHFNQGQITQFIDYRLNKISLRELIEESAQQFQMAHF